MSALYEDLWEQAWKEDHPDDRPDTCEVNSRSSPKSGADAGRALLSGTLSSRGGFEVPGAEGSGGLHVGMYFNVTPLYASAIISEGNVVENFCVCNDLTAEMPT